MSVLHALASGPAHYRGQGINHEGEYFTGELRVQVLEAGRAVLLSYAASLDDGTVVHTESALLATAADGRQCLWPMMSELPGVIPHIEEPSKSVAGGQPRAVFATGPREDTAVFREEITLAFMDGGSLIYAHAWGLPGGGFEDRSSCTLLPSGA